MDPPLLEFLRDAVRRDVPVIGHCLGGQLMSRAFGGEVRVNPVREIGWGEVRVADNGVARDWLGDLQSFDVPVARRDLQHPAGRDACSKASTARTRRLPSVATSACNATSR